MMTKKRQKKDHTVAPQAELHHSGAEVTSHEPAFTGDIPHNSKKEALGPNTKR